MLSTRDEAPNSTSSPGTPKLPVELIHRPDQPVSKSAAWLLATRPKTLWAAAVPVLIGTIVALDDGHFHAAAMACALGGAIGIQIGTNLVNDYSDFAKGADSDERKGPLRVTQSGLLAPRAVLLGAIVAFGTAVLCGLYLIDRGGLPVLAIGAASIASGYLYTAGPRPLGYLGLGDLFVLVFFGPVAVAGTYYVQALTITPAVVILGLAPGLLSVALLSVNNLRDIEEDAAVGKRTLAVRFGARFARWQFVSCIVLAAVIPGLLALSLGTNWWATACLLIIPLAWPSFKAVLGGTSGRDLIPLLGATARLSLIFAALFSISWLI